MTKKIKMQARPAKPDQADHWVDNRAQSEQLPKLKPKRLTIDIDPELHTRLKIHCAQKQVQIADLLRKQIQSLLG
ncbi:plasmid partition protein ParG [Stieleria sp. TO1_6]|uniref:plasmid partition protein ParG n=1 Tax=Stieleria tagensis TaxID=2956795 RepID=UPI00209B0D3C|nr:plasmid partition protein ParG [Stieleria tagensis]MCO8125189.1 plasmid partition protein ParG [Stieleria tagensis]